MTTNRDGLLGLSNIPPPLGVGLADEEDIEASVIARPGLEHELLRTGLEFVAVVSHACVLQRLVKAGELGELTLKLIQSVGDPEVVDNGLRDGKEATHLDSSGPDENTLEGASVPIDGDDPVVGVRNPLVDQCSAVGTKSKGKSIQIIKLHIY